MKLFTLLAFLLALAALTSAISSGIRYQLCGRLLARTVSMICQQDSYNSEDVSKHFDYLQQHYRIFDHVQDDKMMVQRGGGIVEDCCYNSCLPEDIFLYC